MTTQPQSSPSALFSLRAAVVLIAAVLTGLVIGALTLMAGQHLPEAITAGLIAGGASLVPLTQVIGDPTAGSS